MANLDFPGGFEPKYVKGGGELELNYYDISSSNLEIGLYDPLERGADGFLRPAQVSSTTIVGVSGAHIAANKGGQVPVYDQKELVMWAQADEAEINAQTDFDLNYNIVATTPNSITGRSQMEIDSSSQAASVDLPIKILRKVEIVSKEGNELGANVLLECMFNRGIFSAGALG